MFLPIYQPVIIRSAPSAPQTVFYIDMMLDEQNIFEILMLKSDLICFSCPACILCDTVVIIFVIKTIHAELGSCETTLKFANHVRELKLLMSVVILEQRSLVHIFKNKPKSYYAV